MMITTPVWTHLAVSAPRSSLDKKKQTFSLKEQSRIQLLKDQSGFFGTVGRDGKCNILEHDQSNFLKEIHADFLELWEGNSSRIS